MPDIVRPKEMVRMVSSDIPVIGDRGLKTLDDVGVFLMGSFEGCTGCKKCEEGCPERALKVYDLGHKKYQIKIETEHCLGTACKKCEGNCPFKVYQFKELKVVKRNVTA
jgi:NAD-dependent dihydropyrimidine dehydrogenase PreA subunit